MSRMHKRTESELGSQRAIRILQHNMQRSKIVLREIKTQMSADGNVILLMQELYSIEGKVPGFGTEIAVACRGSKQDPPMAAVGIRSRHMTANWEEFERVLLEEKKELRETTLERADDVERMAEQLQATLIRACNAAIPRKKWHNRSVPWWTPELTTGKRRTYRARRRYQATKDPTTREQEKLRYRELPLMYKKAVTKAKTQNW
jgi:hypothetical protein